jgi:hypothetical protein
MEAEKNVVFDWDDEIEFDGEGGNFTTLEEGDYEFEVHKFERSRYTPSASAKTPACNQADITLKVSTENGDAYIVDKFPLASTMEWKISAFFRSVGLKKHGERLKMQWQESIGLKGKAHITKSEGKNQGVFFNNVGYYIDPVAKAEDDEWS